MIFHSLKIIRGNQIIDKLASTQFKIVEQEKDLDKHLYDGSLTAISFLEDVRKGDILEYSYSRKGFNPIFGNRYSGFFDVQYSVPVYNLLYRLVVPAGRTMIIKNRGTDIKPFIQQSRSESVYEWKLSQIEALHVADHLPGWYDPYPAIMLSEFTNWKEVSDWAQTLYPFNVSISNSLQNKILDIQKKNLTNEERTSAALRFVQDEIRYTGIEAGENSHKPHHPNQIFSQRFGDCKDKSYLLCVILRKMGIQADPVLINTEEGKAILNWLPSPSVFDHVTVRVKIDNDVYFFDPTISFQRGNLKNISYPDYQCGLVVSENTESLTTIPLNEKGLVSAKETFNISDNHSPASLIVRTEYSGKYADNIRDDFKNNSRYEMLKKYKKYYSSFFDAIEGDSILYLDDEASGLTTIIEYYTIKDFWKEKDGKTKASLQPFLIDGLLKKPESGDRKAPYSLSFPVNYNEEIEINLPENWDVYNSSDVIEIPSTVFKYDYSSSGNKVTLKYEYKTLKDFIGANELREYLTAYNKIDNNTGFTLTYNDKSTSYVKSSSTTSGTKDFFPALYTVLGIVVLITIAIRKSKKKNNYWR